MSEPIERLLSNTHKLRFSLTSFALLLFCAFLQWRSGAYSSDLAANPDEPAHVVSGLMVHDYFKHLLSPQGSHWPLNPRAFAETYYVHFPKVAIGHWPPLFYLGQAIWMFIFGRSKVALLALMLVITAGTAVMILKEARIIDGEINAFVMVTAFLLLPITQRSLYSVMPEAPLAFLFSAAMIIGGQAFEGRRKWWIPFWLLVMAAMSVNARSAALVPAPWIAMLLAGKKDLLKLRALWAAAVLALLLSLPWLFFGHQIGRLRLMSLIVKAALFPVHAYLCLGPLLFSLVVLGALTAPYREQPRLAMVTGVLLGTWMISSLAMVPWDDRYFICAVPACMVLAALGMRKVAGVASRAFGWRLRASAIALATLVLVVALAYALPLEKKPSAAYAPFAASILTGPDGNRAVYLIAGDADFEGAFVEDFALLDPAANHYILRASKELVLTNWSLSHYQPLFKDPAEMAAFLDQSWISLIVIQKDFERPDVQMLRTTMHELHWRQVSAPGGTLAYQRTTPLPQGKMRIRINMQNSLEKYIEATN